VYVCTEWIHTSGDCCCYCLSVVVQQLPPQGQPATTKNKVPTLIILLLLPLAFLMLAYLLHFLAAMRLHAFIYQSGCNSQYFCLKIPCVQLQQNGLQDVTCIQSNLCQGEGQSAQICMLSSSFTSSVVISTIHYGEYMVVHGNNILLLSGPFLSVLV